MPTLETYKGTLLWHYVPVLPLAITFAALFGLITIAHGCRMVKARMWFCLPFVIGGVCKSDMDPRCSRNLPLTPHPLLVEVIGYISRAAATNSTGDLLPYIIQAIFLVLPPVFFAASLYMVYSRLVRAVQGDRFSLTSPRWTTIIFVSCDFISLNVQSTGSGMLVHPKSANIGDDIIVGGLILQVLMFAGFVMCCLTFNIRFRNHVAKTGATTDVPWQSCLYMLYSTSMAIVVRNIYRVVEFITGQHGYLQDNEWPTYVFDGALMLLVMIGFFIWYPSQLRLNLSDSIIELTSDGASAAEHGYAAKHLEPSL